MNVDEVLSRMQAAYAAPDLPELAKFLAMDEHTFRVWRTRKTVPSKVLIKVSNDTGLSVSWLGDGVLHGNDLAAREPPSVFFESKTKQVNLTAEEQALLDNFRAASAEGRLAIATASAALAKPNLKRKKAA